MSVNRYLPAAHYVAQEIPGILAQLGLKPFISRFVLTETQQGNAWLFVVLEVGPLQHPEDYAASDALNYLSTALHGLPVVLSNSYGLRYAVLLSSPNWLRGPVQHEVEQTQVIDQEPAQNLERYGELEPI